MGSDKKLEPAHQEHGPRMSHPSPVYLDPCSESRSTFTPRELRLSHPNPACLSPSSVPGSTFTFNRPYPNTPQRIFSRPHASSSIFYINPICIILNRIQLKIAQGWSYISPLLSIKGQDLWVKNIPWILQVKNSQFSFSTAYMFSESISLKYHYTFSLYKITNFTIEKSSHLS